MKILVAKSSGFCMGVRRAVEMVLDASAKNGTPTYTYGPLIHNPQVLKLLEDKGIPALDRVPDSGAGTVMIRAHGVPPETKAELRSAGFDVLDATCPRVIKIQAIIKKYTIQGYTSIIIGDKNHPEVIGLLGYAAGKGHVVGSIAELDALPAFDKAIIVAQSTQNTTLFNDISKWAQRSFPHYKIFNTICNTTEERQAEITRLSNAVDAMIVVGGRASGNTRRLAEIAGLSGKPAFLIETETDLDTVDIGSLGTAACIGITAGASTPNWMIKKVFRALEELPYKDKRKRGLQRTLFAIQRGLLLTNIYLALGAGSLSFACCKLLDIRPYWPYVILAMLYVQSMHILNLLTGNKADQYNDPERADFYRRHARLLTTLGLAAGAAGLAAALALGKWPFSILLAMSLMGLSYNLKMVPEKFSGTIYRRMRDIPGSKTFMIAAAWGVLTALLPSLAVNAKIGWTVVFTFCWSAGLVFVRTTFFDILDMQGDRIVGKATLAILLGEKRAMRLLHVLSWTLVALLPVAAALDLVSSLGFGLGVCPLLVLIVLSAYEKGTLLPGVRLEFLIETNFIAAGLIALIWPHL